MELLEVLTQCFSPSGREDKIREIIKEKVAPYVTDVYTDAMGNLIAHKKGNGKKLMLAAHMDEIGFMVTHIEDDGFVRFTTVGGIVSANCINRCVTFENGVVGVISYEEKEGSNNPNPDKMYMDLGVSSREEAEKLVSIGDMAVHEGPFKEMGNCVTAKALDDRCGCWALIRALETHQKCPNELFAVFTVQEELGLRGAKTAAYAIEPDMGFAVDVSFTGDTPNCRKASLSLGEGPGLKMKDSSYIINPKAKAFMLECAQCANIPYQLEAAAYGGTDAGGINLTKSGIPAGTISVPERYVHSPREVVNKKDLENTARLVRQMIETEI